MTLVKEVREQSSWWPLAGSFCPLSSTQWHLAVTGTHPQASFPSPPPSCPTGASRAIRAQCPACVKGSVPVSFGYIVRFVPVSSWTLWWPLFPCHSGHAVGSVPLVTWPGEGHAVRAEQVGPSTFLHLLPVCGQIAESLCRQALPAQGPVDAEAGQGPWSQTGLDWGHLCGWAALNSVGGPVCPWLCRLVSLPTKPL